MNNPEILNIKSLSGDWCDKDIIILHACFQLLTDCIENEKLFTGHVEWNHDEEHKNAKKELENLYNWWIERKNADLESEINDLENEQYEKDNEMLIRLIKVRKYLWT
ncbi:MAG: hypothetical protein KDC05_13795 [Bacteroidales bacterium]|nr:hypothetical protein [Bacteroidales bacterium]